MKKLLVLLLISISLTGCKGCYANYDQRKKGVQKVCPTCIYSVVNNTTSGGYMHIATDTAAKPNIMYSVDFCIGGTYYNAWDVDHLTKIQ